LKDCSVKNNLLILRENNERLYYNLYVNSGFFREPEDKLPVKYKFRLLPVFKSGRRCILMPYQDAHGGTGIEILGNKTRMLLFKVNTNKLEVMLDWPYYIKLIERNKMKYEYYVKRIEVYNNSKKSIKDLYLYLRFLKKDLKISQTVFLKDFKIKFLFNKKKKRYILDFSDAKKLEEINFTPDLSVAYLSKVFEKITKKENKGI